MATIKLSKTEKDLTPSQVEMEVEKLIDTIQEEVEESEKEKDWLSNKSDRLASHVRKTFDEASRMRIDIEKRWLDDLRQYRGQYSPEIYARMGKNRSKAFVRLTRTKVKTVDSRLTDFLFPANGERNWGIEPTPNPEFTPETLYIISQENPDIFNMSPEQFKLFLIEEARKRASNMKRTIDDQLSEIRYREILREVIHSGNVYGTGVLKGPMVSITQNRQYQREVKEDGQMFWRQQTIDELTPFCQNVSIWDIFPDLSATEINDCRYVIHRHRKDKHDLFKLAKREDFDGKKIRQYLQVEQEGDFRKKDYEIELQELGNMLSAYSTTSKSYDKKYELLEFWGYLDAKDLEVSGVRIPEKLRDHVELGACIWVLGDNVIKASLTPIEGVKWPFYFYYYDKDETSIFGEGIPSIMRDVQELTNSAFRAMLDNAAISAGPQIEANMSLLSEDEDPTEVYPFKVWLRTGEGADAEYPAIRVTELPSYTNDFLKMAEAFERYGDEVTTIPRYLWGDQAGGAGRTASGLSMMMGSANITIKDQVKNFDDGITKPFITAMYHWNMQFNSDESIKGDYAVKATGTTSLIAREVYAQSLMNFANITNNPVDLPIVKRPRIIREIAKSLDLDDKGLVLSEEEIAMNQKMQAENAQQEQQFMLNMTETARKYGVSPVDLVNSLKSAFTGLSSGGNNAPQPVA